MTTELDIGIGGRFFDMEDDYGFPSFSYLTAFIRL
jgi:hypothetical protein